MFDRVKAYIIISFFTNLGIASACLFAPGSFRSDSYDVVEGIMPLPYWGVIFAALMLGDLYSLISRSVILARLFGSLTAAVMVAWGIGFLIEVIIGEAHGPTAFIVWLSIAAKDIVIISTPVIRPIEEYVTKEKFD